MSELHGTAAWEVAEGVRSGALSAVEVLDHFTGRIEALNAPLNAFYFLDLESARVAARAVDAAVADGRDPGPWAGVPMGVKELEDVAGWPSEHASLLFAGNVATEDSPQVERLRKSGAILVGKTTAPELGSVAFTNSLIHGVTRNPWDLDRTPGGSSGGSAAAVSAGLVPICTASDGGGSTRLPATWTGLVGLKPTFGRIPQGPGSPGIVNCGVTGCLATTVRDWARWLDVTAGPHPLDAASLPDPGYSYEEKLGRTRVRRMRTAVSVDLGSSAVEPEVAAMVEAAADVLIDAAELSRVHPEVAVRRAGPSWGVLNSVDALAEVGFAYPDRLDELTPVIRFSVEWAMQAELSQASRAAEARHELLRSVVSIFDHADVLVCPTAPLTAFGAEGPMPTEIAGRKVPPTAAAAFTMPFNLTGNPAISVPIGLSASGMPVGMQLVAPRFCEDRLLELARIWEEVHPWQRLAPYGVRRC